MKGGRGRAMQSSHHLPPSPSPLRLWSGVGQEAKELGACSKPHKPWKEQAVPVTKMAGEGRQEGSVTASWGAWWRSLEDLI